MVDWCKAHSGNVGGKIPVDFIMKSRMKSEVLPFSLCLPDAVGLEFVPFGHGDQE